MIATEKLVPKFAIEYIDDNGHFYRADGGPLLKSVTHYNSLLGNPNKSNALIGWAKKLALTTALDGLRERLGKNITIDEAFLGELYKMGWRKPKEALEEAGDVGTKAHAAIDAHINGNTPDLSDPRVKTAFLNFISWLDVNRLKIISGDVAVVSKKYGYGGRADCIALDLRENVLPIDFKTSNSITEKVGGKEVLRAENACQVSAYGQGISETFDLPAPKAGWCVRFDKLKPEFEPIYIPKLKPWFRLFANLLDTAKLLEKARQ